MVEAEWTSLTLGEHSDEMDALSQKLRLLKRKVKVWMRNKSLAMKHDLISIESEIKSLLGSFVSGILSSQDHIRFSDLRSKLNLMLDHELISSLLQSRMTWENLGGANMKYFHSVASARRNQNSIWGIKDDMENLSEDDNGLKYLGVNYFSKILRDDNQTNIMAQLKVIRLFLSFILQEETERFTHQISLEEVEHALKSFKWDKFLG